MVVNLNNVIKKLMVCMIQDNITFLPGAYVPLTAEGKIMADGILASCYAGFPQDLAHLTITPMQKFGEVMRLIFGDDFGFPVYVGTAKQLGKLILPDEQYWSY